MPNLYATLNEIKRSLTISDTNSDTHLLESLEEASRAIDAACRRHFYTVTATRTFDGPGVLRPLLLPYDLLTVTSLAIDTDQDGAFDDETWTATDYTLLPLNSWPKMAIRTTANGDYSWPSGTSTIQIAGTWGFGNGESASPWLATAVTGTVATTTGTTLTASASGTVEAGHTILVESEQMFVSAVSGTAITVQRGVNGTTAAAHSAKAISLAQYPAPIRRACRALAGETFQTAQKAGISEETIGDYSYKRALASSISANPQILNAILNGFQRVS